MIWSPSRASGSAPCALPEQAKAGLHGRTPPRSKRPLLFFLGWLGFAALFATQSISSYSGPPPTPVARLVAAHVLEAAYWAAASLMLHRAAGRIRGAYPAHAVGRLLAAVLLATVGAIVWNVISAWLVDSRQIPFPLWPLILQSAHTTFAYGVLLAVMLLAASTAVHLADETHDRALHQARAEAALVREKLEMLTLHLQPHFLFNTLNTIVGLVPAQPQRAVDVVHRLSVLLRAALQHAGSALVPLQQELNLVDQYLGIARVRHGQRLQIETRVAPGLLQALVPPMLLQPLLENAIQHSVERRSGPGHIRLTVCERGAVLELVVEDDGVGPAAEPVRPDAAGMGLANTRARLAVLFGEQATLSLTARSGGGACAVVRLPRRDQQAEGDRA